MSTVETRSINVAAFAMVRGAKLEGTTPAGRGRVAFSLQIEEEARARSLAADYGGSEIARFLAIRDGLLDRVRSKKRREEKR